MIKNKKIEEKKICDEKKICNKIKTMEHEKDNNEKSSKKKIPKEKNEKKIYVIDLFCGCGGMTTGLIDAGLKVIAGIDIWDKAIESYKNNHDHIAVCADLTKLTPNDFKKYTISIQI